MKVSQSKVGLAAAIVAVCLALTSGSPVQAQEPVGTLGIRGRSVGYGVEILQIKPNSPAERAGLEVGDVIVSIDGLPIRNWDDFVAAKAGPGEVIRLRIRDVRTRNLVHRSVRLL